MLNRRTFQLVLPVALLSIVLGISGCSKEEPVDVRWVSEKWTSRNKLGDNYVLGGIHYETSTSTVHCRVQKERCQSCC